MTMKGLTSISYIIRPAWMLALLSIIVAKSLAFTIASQRCSNSLQQPELALSLSSRSGSTRPRPSTNLYYKQREDEDVERFTASVDTSRLGLQEQEQKRNHGDSIDSTMAIMSNQGTGTVPSHSRPVAAHSLRNIRSMLADVFISGRKGHHTGTKVHIAVLTLISASYVILMRTCAGTRLCRAVMTMNSFALMSDNLISAMGKYIGEGTALRKLAKIRIIAHCLSNLTLLPIAEIVHKHGLISASLAKSIGCVVVGVVLLEIFDWMRFDQSKLILLDNRRSASSTTRNMPGTMHYTSGKVLKMLLPVAILHLVMLAVGSILWSRGASAGLWMVVAVAVSAFSCSLRKPEMELLGESIFMSTLWFAVAQ